VLECYAAGRKSNLRPTRQCLFADTRGSAETATLNNSNSETPLDVMRVLRARKAAWRIPELAELLNLGRRTLYDEVESGRLPAMRFGAAIRINPLDAVIWVEARTTGVLRWAA
jgi:excisionase family DNA binding protein